MNALATRVKMEEPVQIYTIASSANVQMGGRVLLAPKTSMNVVLYKERLMHAKMVELVKIYREVTGVYVPVTGMVLSVLYNMMTAPLLPMTCSVTMVTALMNHGS